MIAPKLLLERCFAGLGLAFVLACFACGSKPADPAPSLSRLPFGVIDVPRSGETLHGTVNVGGWALSEDEISQVAIYVDRNYVLAATLRAPRPDVAKIYAALPDAAASGWNAPLDTASFPPGSHEIVVQAHSKHGASRDIGSITVTFAK
jgi:hypothetical protein